MANININLRANALGHTFAAFRGQTQWRFFGQNFTTPYHFSTYNQGMIALARTMIRFGPQIHAAAMLFGKVAGFLGHNIQAAAAATRGLVHAGTVSGGSLATAGGIGAVFGRSAGQVAEDANALRDRLSSDPLAAMAFGRPMLPVRIGGSQDNMKLLYQGILKLTEVQDEHLRLLKARRMGLEEYLSFAYASPAMRDMVFGMGSQVGTMAKKLRPGAAHNEMYHRAIDAQNQLQGQMFTDWSMPVRHGGNWLKLKFNQLETFLMRAVMYPHVPPQNWGDGKMGAVERNTAALEDLAAWFRDTERKAYGGGPRTGAAIPAALRGFRLQEAIANDTVTLGGVSR